MRPILSHDLMSRWSNRRFHRTPATSLACVPRPTCRFTSSVSPGFAWTIARCDERVSTTGRKCNCTRHIEISNRSTSRLPQARFVYLTTKADRLYTDWTFQQDDCLVFGRETRGLPEELLRANWDNCLKIPMLNPNVRSLNLATAVGIVLFEALRQTSRFE